MVIINNENYYSAREVASKFNVTLETIRDWRTNKGLKAHQVSLRKFMYSEKELERFVGGDK
jgi:DNA-binding transcriptional MerR regulator